MSDKKKKGEEPGYQAASQELEQILQDLEAGDIDLDVLTEKVERAAVLLATCRAKLAATETRVKKITAELAAAEAAAAAGDDDEEEDER